jgi:hypothetical protein
VQLIARSQYRDFGGEWGVEGRTGADVRLVGSGVLRDVLGLMCDWGKLRDEELHGMYCSVNVIRVIRASKMRLVGHVARTEEK